MTSTVEDFLRRLPKPLRGVLQVAVDLSEPFIDVVGRFADEPGTIALLSGGTLDSARHDMLAIRPWLTIRERGHQVVADFGGTTITAGLDPFAALQAIIRHYGLPAPEAASPLSAGLFGYLAYDLKDAVEKLPRTSCDDLSLPRLCMAAPSLLLVHDRSRATTTAHVPIFENDEEAARSRLARFQADLVRAPGPRPRFQVRGLTPELSRDEYIAAVDAIRDYIVRGDVYQVNMSQRFEAEFSGDPFALFASLYQANPAPFFAFIHAGDHQIVSTSPERFVRLCGNEIETRPIKGTRPRGDSPEQDHVLRHDLETSRKDDAELTMIVDLLRNDIGKVCVPGSVRVSEHKRVEGYENVHHLVSVVEGELAADKNAVDLIKAVFPGGSITGCPKIRAMQIIDELEPVRRHIYTGAIGYIGFSGSMDLSIAIRTATITNGRLVFSVGGGVVFDSRAADEFEETLHKGRTLMRALEGDRTPARDRVGWQDGKFKPVADMTVSVEDEGFAYGYGVFETIRVHKGRPLRLDAHLARFQRAWQEFFDAPLVDITWSDVIDHVIARNELHADVAAVKILAASSQPGRSPRLMVTARKYVPRSTSGDGLRLVVYPHGRQSPLAGHKTMNYMLQRVAARWAHSQQADEAVILNADGSLSETNTANILCRINGQWIRPLSTHVLPGTMEQAVCALLTTWGQTVATRRLDVAEFKTADAIILTNALMGVMPVASVDGHPIAVDNDLCRRINDTLLSE
jgi:para-aminobenzoate synthetase component 1